MTLSSRCQFVLLALLATVLLAACSEADEVAVDLTGTASSVTATVTGLPDSAPTLVLSPTPDSVAQASSLPADFSAMLSGLGGHRVAVDLSFVGQDEAGLPVEFGWQSQSTASPIGPGHRLDLTALGDEQAVGFRSMTLVRSGEDSYVYVPDVGCIGGSAAVSDEDLTLPFDPTALLSDLSRAKPVADDQEVNGFVTTRYDFDAEALALPADGPWTASGAAFFAEDAGFITRVEFAISGQGDLLNEDRVLDGAYQIVVDVFDLDDSAPVEVPEACRSALVYPVTNDAYDMTTIEDLVVFESHWPLVDVVNFYLAEMPSRNWNPLAEPDVFDDSAYLTFQKDGKELTIIIEFDQFSETVRVMISP